jgi:hypothetical protein
VHEEENPGKWREGVMCLHDLVHAIVCRGKPDPKYSVGMQQCKKCGAWRSVRYSGYDADYGPSGVDWYKAYPYEGYPPLSEEG